MIYVPINHILSNNSRVLLTKYKRLIFVTNTVHKQKYKLINFEKERQFHLFLPWLKQTWYQSNLYTHFRHKLSPLLCLFLLVHDCIHISIVISQLSSSHILASLKLAGLWFSSHLFIFVIWVFTLLLGIFNFSILSTVVLIELFLHLTSSPLLCI